MMKGRLMQISIFLITNVIVVPLHTRQIVVLSSTNCKNTSLIFFFIYAYICIKITTHKKVVATNYLRHSLIDQWKMQYSLAKYAIVSSSYTTFQPTTTRSIMILKKRKFAQEIYTRARNYNASLKLSKT